VNKQYVLAIILSLAVFLIAACGSDPAPEATTVPTAVPVVTVPTNTPAPTATTAPDPAPAATNTPSPTATAVAIAPTATAQAKPTPTNTPAPTVDLVASRSLLPPHIFVGTAKIDGIAAPLGTIVSALIGDQTVDLSVVDQANGGFSKAIKVDVLGQPVTFKISDFAASQAAITTQVGGANVVNLEASSQ
jgi:hypothetical protein